MKDDDSNKHLNEQEEKELFSRLSINYNRDKADIWASLEERIEQTPTKKLKVITLQPWVKLVAASISLILIVGVFARFYTTTVSVKIASTAKHSLPDGSVVHINSASKISYAPYWWTFSREIKLEGEAFFEVQKGSKFQVKSPQGTTEVLGTSFNIYAHENQYQVLCVTGRVSVKTPNAEEVILTPNQFAELTEEKLVKQENDKKQASILAWREGRFIYNTTPLLKVFKDFERYYNTQLTIKIENPNEFFYTGLLQRNLSLEEALEIVCYSFEFDLKKTSENQFVIIEKKP